MKAKILFHGGYGPCFGKVVFPTENLEISKSPDGDGFYVKGSELIRIGAICMNENDTGFDPLDDYFFYDEEVQVDESFVMLTPKQFLQLSQATGPFEYYYNSTKSTGPHSIKVGGLVFEEIVDS